MKRTFQPKKRQEQKRAWFYEKNEYKSWKKYNKS